MTDKEIFENLLQEMNGKNKMASIKSIYFLYNKIFSEHKNLNYCSRCIQEIINKLNDYFKKNG